VLLTCGNAVVTAGSLATVNPPNPLLRMSWRSRLPRGRAAVAVAVAVVVAVVVPLVALAAAGLTGVFAGPGTASRGHSAGAARSRPLSAPAASPSGPHARTVANARQPGRTSCTAVAHIGDSTSVGMVDPAVLPSAAQRLPAQYAHVGVRHLLADASGGRSIVEALPGQVNGYYTARAMAARGFRGCWVIALGTNDSANIAAGSLAGQAARISQMMSVAHGQPVLWVNTRTLDTSGPYAEANMQRWNQALRQAQARYPNLRIFDWASVARPGWYIPDGIHYTAAGYAARAHAIAQALARAFPAGGHSTSRIVR
jgi:lysophospholipase L1-like esterase